jgi:hypothetical protein
MMPAGLGVFKGPRVEPLAWRAVQRVAFGLISLRERAARLGRFEPWDPEGPERYLTAIFRLPDPAARQLAAAALPLAAPGRYAYPTEALHMTLLNLDPWRERFGPGCEGAAAAVRDALEGAPPVAVGIEGLGLARQSVYARVFSPDASLLRSRLRLVSALGLPPGWVRGHEPALALLPVGLVNVVRFRAPPGAGAARAVAAASRGLRVAAFALEELEVVLADRVLSAERTMELGRAALRASPGRAGA